MNINDFEKTQSDIEEVILLNILDYINKNIKNKTNVKNIVYNFYLLHKDGRRPFRSIEIKNNIDALINVLSSYYIKDYNYIKKRIYIDKIFVECENDVHINFNFDNTYITVNNKCLKDEDFKSIPGIIVSKNCYYFKLLCNNLINSCIYSLINGRCDVISNFSYLKLKRGFKEIDEAKEICYILNKFIIEKILNPVILKISELNELPDNSKKELVSNYIRNYHGNDQIIRHSIDEILEIVKKEF